MATTRAERRQAILVLVDESLYECEEQHELSNVAHARRRLLLSSDLRRGDEKKLTKLGRSPGGPEWAARFGHRAPRRLA